MIIPSDSESLGPRITEFSTAVRRSEQRVEQIRQYGDAASPRQDTVFDEASDELLTQMEELRVAETELRQQNEELESSRLLIDLERSRYRELFELAPDAYIVTDLAGTVKEANQAAGTLLQMRPNHMIGKPLVLFIPFEQRKEFRNRLTHFFKLAGGGEWPFELVARDRQLVSVSAKVVMSAPAGGKSALLRWALRDMTWQIQIERRLRELNEQLEQTVNDRTAKLEDALERERTANLVKGEFLTRLSHEIRTPLHALMGYTDMLREGMHGPVTDIQRRDLTRMQQTHQHLLSLITHILDFARVESGQVRLDMAPVIVAELIPVVLGILQPQCTNKNIQCMDLESPDDAIVLADANACRQILINLIGNAIKFSGDENTISISWEIRGTLAGIHVSDTGPGIPEDKIDLIFEPFIQLPDSEEPHSGTGLGLPISRGLAEAMGGSLEVQSVIGEGSTFSLWLPLAIPAHQSAA